MNINIPPDSEEWLFSTHDRQDGGLWSFRWPPPCEVDDDLIFRFGGKIVAKGTVCEIRPPGELDGPAHHGRRMLRGWKVIWLWENFIDLRGKFKAVEILEREQKQRRQTVLRKGQHEPSR